MARKTKYDTHIKPNFDKIERLIKEDAEDKKICAALGVSPAVWYKYKKEKKEFKEFVEKIEAEKVNKAVSDLRSTLKNRPKPDDLVALLVKSMGKKPTPAVVMEVTCFLYPEMNPYLQVKKYDAETRRLNVEKGSDNKELIEALGRMFNGVPSNI